MTDQEKKPSVHFDDLNLLGKTVFLTGAAIRTTATLIDSLIEHAADLYIEAEKAFLEEVDPEIEDAKILEEHVEDQKGKKRG